jgi:hypothetical protein
MRLALPVTELDALSIPRGPKFDKVLEDLFELQLKGRARDPEFRAKILRKLAGIKEEKKKPEKEKKKRKDKDAGAKSGDKHAESEAHAHTDHKPGEAEEGRSGRHPTAKTPAHPSTSRSAAGHAASPKSHAKVSNHAEHSHARKHSARSASKAKSHHGKKARR